MFQVTHSSPNYNRVIGTFDSLEDAVAASTAAGGIYDDNATEAMDAGRKKDMCWSVRGQPQDGMWIEVV